MTLNCFWWNLPSITSTCSSFIVYVEGFLEDIVTISKTSCLNCGLWRFLECKSFFEIRSLFPILNWVFRYYCNGLLYKKESKSDILTFFGFKSMEHFCIFFGNSEIWLFAEVFGSKVFNVTVEYTFQESYCTFSKCSFSQLENFLNSIQKTTSFCQDYWHSVTFRSTSSSLRYIMFW